MANLEYTTLTASQAAKFLSIHVNTLRRWTNKGTLECYRVGRRGDRRFTQQDIERFILKGTSPQ